MSNPYAEHNEQGKANFDHVYDLPDSRGYFSALGALDYRAPGHGSRVFSALLQAIGQDEISPKVLDLCCSYGVNAALLKYDLTLDDLYARYGSEDLRDLSCEGLAADAADFYADRLKTSPPEIIGTDAARTPSPTRFERAFSTRGPAKTWNRTSRQKTYSGPREARGS